MSRGRAQASLGVEGEIIGQRTALAHVAREVGRRQRGPRVGRDRVAPEGLGLALQRVDEGGPIVGQRAAVAHVTRRRRHAAPCVGGDVVAPEVALAVAAEGVDEAADARQRAAPLDVSRRGRQCRPGVAADVVTPEAFLAIALQHVQVGPVGGDSAALFDVGRRGRQHRPAVAGDVVAPEAVAVAQHGVDIVNAADVEVLDAAPLVEVVRGRRHLRPRVGGDVVAIEDLGVAFAGVKDAAARVGQAAALLDAVGRLIQSSPGAAGDAVAREVLLVGAGQAEDGRRTAAGDDLARHAGFVAAQVPGDDAAAAVGADQNRVGHACGELIAAGCRGRCVEAEHALRSRGAGVGEGLEHAGRHRRRDRVGRDAGCAAARHRQAGGDAGDRRGALELDAHDDRAANGRRDRRGNHRSRRGLRRRCPVPKEDHRLLAGHLGVAGGLQHHIVPFSAVPIDIVGPAAAGVNRHHHAVRGGAARQHDHVGVAVGGCRTAGLDRPRACRRYRVPGPGAVAHLSRRRAVDAVGRQQVAAQGLESHRHVLSSAGQGAGGSVLHVDPGRAIPYRQPGAAAAGDDAHADAVAEGISRDGHPLRLGSNASRRRDRGFAAPRGGCRVPDAVEEVDACCRRLAVDHHGPAALRLEGDVDRCQRAAAGVQRLLGAPGRAAPDAGIVCARGRAVDQGQLIAARPRGHAQVLRLVVGGQRRGGAPGAAHTRGKAQLVVDAGRGRRVVVPDHHQIAAALLIGHSRAPVDVRVGREIGGGQAALRAVGGRHGQRRPGCPVPDGAGDLRPGMGEGNYPLSGRRAGGAGCHLDARAHVGADQWGGEVIVAVRVEQAIEEGVVVVVVDPHARGRHRVLSRLARQRHIRAKDASGVGAAAHVGDAGRQRVDDAHILQQVEAGEEGAQREVQLLARRGIGQVDRLAQHRNEGEVGRQEVLAGAKRNVVLRDGREVTARQIRVAGVHHHLVVARSQVAEQVQPVRPAAGAAHQHAVQVEVDRDARQRRVARIEDAVGVVVKKDLVADGAGRDPPEAEVGVVVGPRQVGDGLRIGRRCLEGNAEVGDEDGVGWIHVGNIVEALGQAGEAVDAAGARGRCGHQRIDARRDHAVAVGILVETHGYAKDAGVSARIEDAVVGHVLEDLVANDAGPARPVAPVRAEEDLVQSQVLAIRGRCRAAIGIGGQNPAAGHAARAGVRHADGIAARQETGEDVVAVGVGYDGAGRGEATGGRG